jgi:hypothetical protein
MLQELRGNVLSILQVYLEKHLGEPAQFKAKLQFERAHQLAMSDLRIGF